MQTSLGQRKTAIAVLFAAILATAAVLRLLPMSAELWLDELWSVEFARTAASPLQIWTGPHHHHDNNHKLNTLALYFVPDGAPYAAYRLHSYVAGLFAVVLAGVAAWRRGTLEAGIAAFLFAVEGWFVLSSAEARGYALVIAFALAAYLALRRYLDVGGWAALLLFWASVALGFLAHLTFLHVYLALGVWSVYRFARRRESAGGEIVQVLRCHALPAGFFVLLYLTDVRGMELGGGPILPPAEVVGSLLARGLGLPFTHEAAWLAAPVLLLGLGVTAFGLYLLRQAGSDEWVFYGMVIVGAPLVLLGKVLLGQTPMFLYERYFFIPFAFFLLLLAHVLATIARRSTARRLIVGVVLVAIGVGNVWRVVAFAEGGRGAFRDVLAYVDRAMPDNEGTIVLAGDHDFRVSKYVAFYGRYSGSRRPFVYQAAPLARAGVPWLLVHRPDGGAAPEPTVMDLNGNEYRQAEAFHAARVGGWDWYVYRRAGDEVIAQQ